MAQVKITELPETTEVQDSDVLIVDNGSVTRKVKKSNLLKDVGKVDDVKVNGTSIVTNKVANLIVDTTLNSSSNITSRKTNK